jgi:hypothetical protein
MQGHGERHGVVGGAVEILQSYGGVLGQAGLAVVVEDAHVVQALRVILGGRSLEPPPGKLDRNKFIK